MPIYEFECKCGARFEDLVAGGTERVPCPACGSARTTRVISAFSPPGRLPRGARARDSESRRREREAARRERLAETRKKRAAGEIPPPRQGRGRG
ncbi:MAG: zinc ribbon domain-containing protein [Solirubrobacterales bacterium]